MSGRKAGDARDLVSFTNPLASEAGNLSTRDQAVHFDIIINTIYISICKLDWQRDLRKRCEGPSCEL